MYIGGKYQNSGGVYPLTENSDDDDPVNADIFNFNVVLVKLTVTGLVEDGLKEKYKPR